MAGNTGKMTAAAITARGPRMCLTEIRNGERTIGVIVRREGPDGTVVRVGAPLRFTNLKYFTWSKSYSLRYLLAVGRSMLWKNSW